MVEDATELAAMEEHILGCESCAERADEAQDYVDAIRVAALDFSDPYERASTEKRVGGLATASLSDLPGLTIKCGIGYSAVLPHAAGNSDDAIRSS